MNVRQVIAQHIGVGNALAIYQGAMHSNLMDRHKTYGELQDICAKEIPNLDNVNETHIVACHLRNSVFCLIPV